MNVHFFHKKCRFGISYNSWDPVEATTFQNSKSQNAVETIIGGNETPIDQPNIHHIDNSTANNNISDSTIDYKI